MSLSLRVHPEAAEELDAAIAWHDQGGFGRGEAFEAAYAGLSIDACCGPTPARSTRWRIWMWSCVPLVWADRCSGSSTLSKTKICGSSPSRTSVARQGIGRHGWKKRFPAKPFAPPGSCNRGC